MKNFHSSFTLPKISRNISKQEDPKYNDEASGWLMQICQNKFATTEVSHLKWNGKWYFDCTLEKALRDGADPNALDKNSCPPLFYAYLYKNNEAEKLLIKKGANPFLKNCSKKFYELAEKN